MRPLITVLILSSLLFAGCSNEGATPEPPDIELHTAAFNGDLEAVKVHIAAGTDLNAPGVDNGDTALNIACVFGRAEVASALIGAGADLERKNNSGTGPLFNAAFFCHPSIVRELLDAGADVNTTDVNGTPIRQVMDAPWEVMEGIYRTVYDALDLPLDGAHIQATRPTIAKILNEHGG